MIRDLILSPAAAGYRAPYSESFLSNLGTDSEDASRIDYVACGHRQPILRFIMKPVQSTSERFVEVAQVIRQGKNKTELCCRFEMQIGQYVEGQLQFPMHAAGVPFELGSDDQHP